MNKKNIIDFTLSELINDKKLFHSLKYKRLYKQTKKELEDYKGSRLKYKRLYEQTKKELEDYKGSRLKYKRLASYYEFKYNKLINKKRYRIINFLIKTIKFPISVIYPKMGKKYKKNSQVRNENKAIMEYSDLTSKLLRKLIFDFFKENINNNYPYTLIYADLNMNVVDGSSIWLSSVVNLFSTKSKIIIISKHNIVNDLIVSNIKKLDDIIIVEPKHLNLDDNLSLDTINKLLIYIDEIVPSIQNLIVRGTEAITEVIKTNNFKYRLVPYLTNFYLQENNKIEIKDEAARTIKLVNLQAKYWLWQTKEMKDFIEKTLQISFDNYIIFPPIIEELNLKNNTVISNNKNYITIGYAGKIQPDWGVLELIEEVEKLRKKGLNIKLKIVSSKISWRGTIKTGNGFVEKVKKNLQKDFVEYLENLNREESMIAMLDVDYIWSWRHSAFENTTLELSTKLLEGVSLGKPVINYPSKIHQNALGGDYPYYLKSLDELENVLNYKVDNTYLEKKKAEILSKYSFSSRVDSIDKLFKNLDKTIFLLNGHDFKFIDHYYSFLKSSGYLIYKDYWEWGKEDNLDRSKYLLNKANIVFSEWGLANAVWYSKNIKNQQHKHYCRIHLQEINKKAFKFGKQINFNGIRKMVIVSKNVQKKYIKYFGVDKDKTAWIPNYVLTDDFKPKYLKSELGLSFGMVGITPQRKRLDRAISLMEKLLKSYPEAKLYIKGKRPEEYEWMHAPGRVQELDYYYEQYERIEKNPLLKEAVIFDGFDNDMPLWYQKIDFILSPSDFESFHYALADGVSSGCLPIVWNWDEADDIYDKNWIVSNTYEAFTRIQWYKSLNTKDFQNLINKNRELIINRYGYKTVYSKLSKLIGIETKEDENV